MTSTFEMLDIAIRIIFLRALLIIELSIKEINCQKTDLVEKYLFLPIVI
ncbi:hypothetical protein [Flavobacterium sp. 7A]|nr:hypothetical protein [Flavobacterium sp. 7A]MCW2120742.1 hypothetical protein [Flavobacterium sp. 7A]